MRYLTYFTGQNNRIDIHNSWLGSEQVYYNGELVSKARSFFGFKHSFEVTEGGKTTLYHIVISYKFPLRIGFDIYRNGMALLLS
jgi:hypothetical protein